MRNGATAAPGASCCTISHSWKNRTMVGTISARPSAAAALATLRRFVTCATLLEATITHHSASNTYIAFPFYCRVGRRKKLIDIHVSPAINASANSAIHSLAGTITSAVLIVASVDRERTAATQAQPMNIRGSTGCSS